MSGRTAFRRLAGLLLMAFALAGFSGGSAIAETAEQVRVDGGIHKGFGRLVFRWDRATPFTAVAENQRLTIRFDEPFRAGYGRAERVLRRWIGSAEPGDDGRSVSFPLKRPVKVRTFHHRGAAVIDLVRLPAARARPPETRETVPVTPAAGPEDAAPSIRVRTGEHPGYSRIVFDWPRRVPYEIGREGQEVTLHFEAPARFRLPRDGRAPAKTIARARVENVPSGSAVRLSIPPDARVRHLRVGNRVVVDVYQAGSTHRPKAGPRLADAADVPLEAAVAETSGADKPAADDAPATSNDAAMADGPAVASDAPAAEAAKDAVSDKAATPAKKSRPKRPAAEPAEAKETSPTATGPVDPAATAPAATEISEPEAAATATAATTEPLPTVAPERDQGTESVVLRFEWLDPVAAAVFSRGEHLWIVFDAPGRIDPDAIVDESDGIVVGVEPVPAADATALRLRLADNVQAAVGREGLTWLVELAEDVPPLEVALEPAVRSDAPLGPSVFLANAGPAKLVTLTDPEVGDDIIVAPLLPRGRGIERTYDYPQFRLLPSAQGVAVVSKTSDLLIRSLERGIDISAEGGLHVSEVSPEVQSQRALGDVGRLSRAVELAQWQEPQQDTFAAERQRLLRAAAEAEAGVREKTRLDLARFYLSHGFGVEGLGVLRLVIEDRPAAESEPWFRLMRGIGRFLVGRFGEAAEDFSHDAVADVDEAAFWRAMTTAARGRPADAAETFIRTGAIALGYPTALRVPAVTQIAESLAAAGHAERARPYLDVLAAEPAGSPAPERLAYLEGRWHEAADEADAALARYDAAAAGDDRRVRALATLAATDLRLRTGAIDAAAALETLDDLRVAWRGDALEFEVLRQYGRLAIREGGYAKGLRALRAAATHFPEAAEAGGVADTMAETFEAMYLGGEADALPPLQAIALYDEFRELTPAGDAGNEMIRQLADRLVAVDLLDRAAGLLEDQVRVRLTGAERARVGARLALIRLLDRQPEAALAALDASAVQSATAGDAALLRQRSRLRARALLELGRSEDALAALDGDQSVEADLVRAELFWQSRDWTQASEALQRIADASGARAGEPLDEQQARYVLNRAVALTLGGNESDLASLRTSYGPAMNATPFGDAFRLIAAGEPDSDGDLLGTLDQGVAEVEGFQAFLSVYRDRLRREGLSTIN